MATSFKVGQRVKRVAAYIAEIRIGATGTVTGLRENPRAGQPPEVVVRWDEPQPREMSAYAAWTLAPLTDPNSEWADEQVKKLLRLKFEEPRVEKVRA